MSIYLFVCLECWKYEPRERPNMQKVVSTLKNIISLEQKDRKLNRILINVTMKIEKVVSLRTSKQISK